MPASSKKIERSLAFYNAVPNLLWSAVSLIPLTVFCYRYIPRPALYIFIAVSLIPAFFRKTFLDRIQIAKTARVYRLLKVDAINKIAQNGALINRLMKRKYPGYQGVRRQSMARVISQTYMFEKFHWILFVFFLLVTIAALAQARFYWAIGLTILNIGYNVYPNLLQQYVRVKLKRRV